jgi:hypothetical protein
MLISTIDFDLDAGLNVLGYDTGVGLILMLTARSFASGVAESDSSLFGLRLLRAGLRFLLSALVCAHVIPPVSSVIFPVPL